MATDRREIEKLKGYNVKHFGHRLPYTAADSDDIKQEVELACLEAEQRFDADKGASLATFQSRYAVGMVKNMLTRKSNGSGIKYSEKHGLRRVDCTNTSKLDDVWERMSRAQRAEAAEKGASLVGMDDPAEEDMRRAVRVLLADLPEAEFEVITRRYFLGESCLQVAAKMGLGHPWNVCVIERRALEILKTAALSLGLQDGLADIGASFSDGRTDVELEDVDA
jgi:RNA polymerase sigma factor (sigma-70 family)